MTLQKRGKEQHQKKKFWPAISRVAAMCPTLLQVQPKPSGNASSAPLTEDTPWPSTGKMLGNLFEERNWLLPKDYLVAENKKEDTTIDTAKPPLKDEPKMEEQTTSQKRNVAGAPTAPFASPKREKGRTNSNRNPYQIHKPKDLIL